MERWLLLILDDFWVKSALEDITPSRWKNQLSIVATLI